MITYKLIAASKTDEATAEAGQVHAWVRSTFQTNPHLLERRPEEYRKFATSKQLLGAFDNVAGPIGLIYFTQNDEHNEIEVGGMVVDPAFESQGIGQCLAHFVLALIFVLDRNRINTHNVVCHVHKDNKARDPRPLITGLLNFSPLGPVQFPSEQYPNLHSADGKFVYADKYQIGYPDTLISVAKWLERFDENQNDMRIDLFGNLTLSSWAGALREIASHYSNN